MTDDVTVPMASDATPTPDGLVHPIQENPDESKSSVIGPTHPPLKCLTNKVL